jgi:D-alanyl-D-alanine carboxypeptidase
MPDYSEDIYERLKKLQKNILSGKHIKQAIFSIESTDQSFRWTGAKGTDSGSNKDCENTPFFIASIDKLYNSALIMILNETGQLSLDDSISTYLPNSITRGLHQMHGVDYSHRIKIKHLLSHTSGLADWLEDYPKNGLSTIDRVLKNGDIAMTMDDVISIVRELNPHFPPQDLHAGHHKIRYCDTNYMLIIAIIEAVAGRPLHRVYEQLLIRPLNLRHTYFPGYSLPLDSIPEAMVIRAKGQPLYIPQLIRSIRGIYSTASDIILFFRKLIQNDVYQKREILSLMLKNWNRFGFPLDRAALRAPGWPIEYGLGVMRYQLPRLFAPIHTMPIVLGHTGSTGCWLFWCPEWNLLLSGSVNEVTAGAVPYRVVPKILKILRPLQKMRK